MLMAGPVVATENTCIRLHIKAKLPDPTPSSDVSMSKQELQEKAKTENEQMVNETYGQKALPRRAL